MLKKKMIQEMTFLLKELRSVSQNLLKTREAVLKIADESNGGLVAYRLSDKPKLMISTLGHDIIKGLDADIEDMVRKISPNAFSPGSLVLKSGHLNPSEGGNPSGRDKAIVVLDSDGFEIIIPVSGISGSKLMSDQFLAYGAEWATYFALGGKDDMEKDPRLKMQFELYPVDAVVFLDKVKKMESTLKNNLEFLDGYSTYGQKPPSGGNDRFDLIATKGKEKINISVKYGTTKRLGAAKSSRTENSSANIFKSISRNPYGPDDERSSLTWRTGDKIPVPGKTPAQVELSEIQDTLESHPEWINSLERDSKDILGVPSETTQDYAIIQFSNPNDVTVTKPSGRIKNVSIKRGPSFKRAYLVDAVNDLGEVIEDVLHVELRLTDNKYTQWYRGAGWSSVL